MLNELQAKMACEYLEKCAANVGGDVEVVRNINGDFTMFRKGMNNRFCRVSLEEMTETFNRKVMWLMED